MKNWKTLLIVAGCVVLATPVYAVLPAADSADTQGHITRSPQELWKLDRELVDRALAERGIEPGTLDRDMNILSVLKGTPDAQNAANLLKLESQQCWLRDIARGLEAFRKKNTIDVWHEKGPYLHGASFKHVGLLGELDEQTFGNYLASRGLTEIEELGFLLDRAVKRKVEADLKKAATEVARANEAFEEAANAFEKEMVKLGLMSAPSHKPPALNRIYQVRIKEPAFPAGFRRAFLLGDKIGERRGS